MIHGHLLIPGGGQHAWEQLKAPPLICFNWSLETFFKFFIINNNLVKLEILRLVSAAASVVRHTLPFSFD